MVLSSRIWLIAALATVGFLTDSRHFASGRERRSAVAAAAEVDTACRCRLERRGELAVAETPNFRVTSHNTVADAERVARRCEWLRASLNATWLPDLPAANWTRRCEVVVHRDQSGYVAAVGRAGAATSGSADIREDGEGGLLRRIDLRADVADVATTALPHEMTHVVLAEVFGAKPAPLWADEGMAILADPPEKRRRHAQDLHRALAQGRHFDPVALLVLDGYPEADRWGTFYGQSAATVEFLVERKSEAEFVRFLQLADEGGYDAALREVYGLENAAMLRSAWGARISTVSVSQ